MELNNRGKPSVLVFADWFEPGFKAGGPIRSCLNFVQQMKDDYRIFVITGDRDLNSSSRYPDVIIDKWSLFEEGVNILYCSPSSLSWKNILQQIKYIHPDFIYLNSMYSKCFTVYPLLMKRTGLITSKMILAPRGMLRATAIQFKKSKKELFFSLFRLLRMHKLVHFHATDPVELNDIRKQFGNNTSVSLVPNFGNLVDEYPGTVLKKPGALAIVFVGRLHPIKNLNYLLDVLSCVSGDVSLTVVGSEEDTQYATRCKKMAAGLPSNINVEFTGELPYTQLAQLVHRHHIFALPTLGENFGHSVFEAMSQGKPVLISDQTPWRNLAPVKAGWDISLQQKEEFMKALQQAIQFDQREYNDWSEAAWRYAKSFSATSGTRNSYRKLFS